ncbi:MAG: hypothetical protein KDD47_25560, partial [Acidobacteria bacterium]|nr:hypothetical protein [Acidobacteriota bacterium]
MTLPERTREVGALLLLAAILGLGLYVKVDVTRHLDPELRPYLSDADGSLYFYTHDSFLYYRMSRNVLDHGHAGESLRAGKAWDDLTFAPKGRPSSPSLLAWVQALAYRVTPSGVSLLAAACFLPAVLSCAVVLFLFLLGLDLGGLRCGLAGALIAALHPEMAAHC